MYWTSTDLFRTGLPPQEQQSDEATPHEIFRNSIMEQQTAQSLDCENSGVRVTWYHELLNFFQILTITKLRLISIFFCCELSEIKFDKKIWSYFQSY